MSDFVDRLNEVRERRKQQREQQSRVYYERSVTDRLEQIRDKEQPTELSVTNFPEPTITAKDIDDLTDDLGKLLEAVNQENRTNTKDTTKQLVETLQKIDSKTEMSGVQASLTALAKQLETLPQRMPQPKDRTEEVVNAVKGLKLDPKIDVRVPDVKVPAIAVPKIDTKNMESAVNELVKTVGAILAYLGDHKPVVNVDMESVKSGLEAVRSQIQNIVFPVPEYPTKVPLHGTGSDGVLERVTTDRGAVATTGAALHTQIKLNSGNTNIQYIGKAPMGSATSAATWQVSRLDTTGSELVKTWADGNSSYDNVFDNRESIMYQ